jgi:hypothetical protein
MKECLFILVVLFFVVGFFCGVIAVLLFDRTEINLEDKYIETK